MLLNESFIILSPPLQINRCKFCTDWCKVVYLTYKVVVNNSIITYKTR